MKIYYCRRRSVRHHRDAAGHFAKKDNSAGKKSAEKARQSSKIAQDYSEDAHKKSLSMND